MTLKEILSGISKQEQLRQIRQTGREKAQEIAKYLSTLPYVDCVLLFGSLVHDTSKMSNFDIDMIICVEKKKMAKQCLALTHLGPTTLIEEDLKNRGFEIGPGKRFGLDASVYFTDAIVAIYQHGHNNAPGQNEENEVYDYFRNIISRSEVLYCRNEKISTLLQKFASGIKLSIK